MDNGTCTCAPPPEPCQNDIGLAAGIGVLVAGLVILLTWLLFYYCYRKSYPWMEKLLGTKQYQRRGASSHKYFSGNYFVDANDSYLLESGKPPVDFHYFHESNGMKQNAVPAEGSQLKTPDGTAHRQLAQQRSQSSAALLQDIGTSSNFSPDLGDRANFPIIASNEIPHATMDSTLSLRSNTTVAAMDLSYWPSLPGESAVDLRPPVLTARVGSKGGDFVSESMHVTLTVPSNAVENVTTMTIGTSSRPEDQPELEQASSLVTAIYSCSPAVGTNGACRLRVPLSCHLMDVDDSEESGYDALPEVSNLTVMVNRCVGDTASSEWLDMGAIRDFVESSEEAREGDGPAGYVEFDVEGGALYTVRCDSGIWVKSMCLSHFAASLDEDQTWALRVFLHRDKTVDYERICQYAKEFNMMPVGMPQPFHLPQHSYVHVLISSITEGCALEGSSHGVLHGEGCWPNVEQPPFVEFRLRQVHGCLPLPLLRVRMDVVIADDFDNITFELLSQWSAQAQMKMDKKMPDPLLPKGRSSDAWPWILVSPWQQLSSAQVKQMSSILDQPLMGDQDYSTLAALLGYTEEQVKFFSLQRPSPTEALLKDLHTRLPVTRVNDRLLVSLGRMGAVWLSDFLRQACRVDRAQMYEDLESSVGDTLPKRAASGIYSSIRRTLDGTLKLTDEEQNDSIGHYQRRVQRMSGRKMVTKRRTSTGGSASVALYASATLTRNPPTSAPPVVDDKQSPQSSWNKPLLNRHSSSASSENVTDGLASQTSPDNVGPLISSQHSNLELTSSDHSHKLKQRGMSTSALYSSTKVVVEKHGRLAQVLDETGPTSTVYTVHHDPSAPHRAILQPAPYIDYRLRSCIHESYDAENEQESFMNRVAKKLTRTSSMPSTQRNERRKAKRRPASNEVLEDVPSSEHHPLGHLASSRSRLTQSEAKPSIGGGRKKMSPYEEHIVPLPRKESLHPRPITGGSKR